MVTVITGAQWGNEGKGKITDIIAEKTDIAVRAQGGNNAVHTVRINGKTCDVRFVPSAIQFGSTICCIAAGAVVDPPALLEEIEALKGCSADTDRILLDTRAHVVMPYHILFDELQELFRGKKDIGTSRLGIGPCYQDKVERCGIRICDLFDFDRLSEKLEEILNIKNAVIEKVYGSNGFSAQQIAREYYSHAQKLRSHVTDTSAFVYDAVKSGKNVLFESAQGALLDIDMGTYPYVTSSHPTSAGACIGCGIGPTLIDSCLGVAKAYTTREGNGPFPTEVFGDICDKIAVSGGEYSAAGKRRCGWFDMVILKFAVRVNGMTDLCLNKLDTLTGIGKLKICVNYRRSGEIITDFPASIEELGMCEPEYTELDGWDEDITGCRSFDMLPEAAKNYVLTVEKLSGCKISMICVGPEKEQYILR